MSDLFEQITEATRAIQARWAGRPSIGIILGTGLGALAQDVQAEATFPYAELPHFPQSTVLGHAEFAAFVQRFDLETVSRETQLDPAQIERLARTIRERFGARYVTLWKVPAFQRLAWQLGRVPGVSVAYSDENYLVVDLGKR